MKTRFAQMARAIAVGVLVYAAAPAASAPVLQPHPRIWISPAIKARMQADRLANTQEWQTLKNWCDARVGTNQPELYNYLEWYTCVMNFGLAYQISGDATYGNEGVKYLTALLRDEDTIGDGLGGTNAIDMDAGYVSRSLGTGVAVGRDWLDGAPNLTPALINECTTRMGEWYTWVHQPTTFGIDEPEDNYYAGHFAMTYTASIAFEGDAGYNMVWQTKAEEMWDDVADLLNTECSGGDFGEGWNYGPWAMREYIGYPFALETGTTRPNHWDEIDIAGELARSQVSMLHPSREYFSDDGRWSGDDKGDPRSTLARMLTTISDTDATEKGLAKWFTNHLEWQPGGPDPWERMLYTDTSVVEVAPTPATVGGLTWKMWGHAVARGADWTDQDATYVDVVAWTHGAEEHNFGEVKISSREELLLTDAQTWQLEGEYSNTPRIAGTHTYAPQQEVWHETAVMTVDFVDEVYSYFKIDNYDQAYNGVNDDDPSCSYMQRDVVFLPPDHVVVYDNITASTLANTINEAWHVMGDPTFSGDTATLTRTNSKLFLRTLSPAVTYTETSTDATRDDTFRIDANVVTPSIQNHIVTLFETADSSQPSMTAATLMSATGFTGVHVDDSTEGLVALFATAPNPTENGCDFSFTPAAADTRVVLVGMDPLEDYDVDVTAGSGGQLDVSVTMGTTYTAADDGSLTFNVSATPSAVQYWESYE